MSGESAHEALHDELGLLVIRVDAQLAVCYVNAFCLRLLGYDRLDQVFQWPLADLLKLDATESQEFLALVSEVGAYGYLGALATTVTASGGQRFRISWSLERHAGSDAIRAPICVVGADVTRVHQNMKAAALFRDVAQHNPLSIIITDAHLSIVFANPAASAISGYSAEDLIGSSPRLFRSGLTPEATYRELWAALHAGTVWTGEFTNQRKDGAIYRQRMTISPIVDDQGCVSSYFSIAEEVSKERELEDRLEALTSTDALTGLHNRAGFMNELDVYKRQPPTRLWRPRSCIRKN